MKQLRWKDFSLVSKIVIEVGMIAVLLFAMNMLFYVRINNSMQKMDNVYASNAELTELSQVFEKVQDNMYKYLKVRHLAHVVRVDARFALLFKNSIDQLVQIFQDRKSTRLNSSHNLRSRMPSSA